jgi:transcriptional regulator with PAS, ATPase and Fis domain
MDSYYSEGTLISDIKNAFSIVGNSYDINNAVKLLIQAAPTDLSILIMGETGTGKEVFANAAHGLSKRKGKPFVSVNCAAIPETLLESELFGHEKGAFTGAVDQRIGFFETANKGTIFLDEIGEMPLGTQSKLLRILETGEFTRLGSSITKKVDVRVIGATNKDLEKASNEGKFRSDLYYRLNTVQIILAPLRKRPQDIPLLAEHFARLTCKKLGLPYLGFSEDAISVLKSLPWPGNVRELKNLIDKVITFHKGDYVTPEILRNYIPPALPAFEIKTISKENSLVTLSEPEYNGNPELSLIFRTLLELKSDITDIKRYIHNLAVAINEMMHKSDSNSMPSVEEVKTVEEFFDKSDSINLETIERDLIKTALKKFRGNRRQVAEALGISVRTLYRKIALYDLENVS